MSIFTQPRRDGATARTRRRTDPRSMACGILALMILGTSAAPGDETQPSAPAALSRAYTVSLAAEHTAQVRHSPWVSPTPSADRQLVIGQTRGWPEKPAIPPQNVYGYQITDRAATGPKKSVILASGNHNTEHTGSWALQGAVDFLLSDDQRAAALRQSAVFYVYPLVNPDGRHTRSGRGNPELKANGGGGDHNRVWNTTGRSAAIDLLTAAMKKDTGGRADYLFDFHSTGSTHVRMTRDLLDEPFAQMLGSQEIGISTRASAGHPGMLRVWAASEDGLNVPFSLCPELSSRLDPETALEIGCNYMRALHAVLVNTPAATH